jgi:hypothetical protein
LFFAAYNTGTPLLAVSAVVAVGVFLFLVKKQQRADAQRKLSQELYLIYEEEAAYLRTGTLPWNDGKEYTDDTHPYAADLDLFGPRSLYQHLNRTATQMGRDKLAAALTSLPAAATILQQQQAGNYGYT